MNKYYVINPKDNKVLASGASLEALDGEITSGAIICEGVYKATMTLEKFTDNANNLNPIKSLPVQNFRATKKTPIKRNRKKWALDTSHKNAGAEWTDERVLQLKELYELGLPGSKLTERTGRSCGSIYVKLMALGYNEPGMWNRIHKQ